MAIVQKEAALLHFWIFLFKHFYSFSLAFDFFAINERNGSKIFTFWAISKIRCKGFFKCDPWKTLVMMNKLVAVEPAFFYPLNRYLWDSWNQHKICSSIFALVLLRFMAVHTAVITAVFNPSLGNIKKNWAMFLWQGIEKQTEEKINTNNSLF